MDGSNILVLNANRPRSEPYTTSEIIAEGTGVARRKVRDVIRKYETELWSFGKVASYQATLGSGQSAKVYALNEQQATFLLTLLKNTPVVVAFKKELVRQFYEMRRALEERASPVWASTRSFGKEVRRTETETIKQFVDYATEQGSQHAARYYVTLSRLADCTAGIVVRDKAQTAELTFLYLVEKMIAQEIMAGISSKRPYKEIYRTIKQRLFSLQLMMSSKSE